MTAAECLCIVSGVNLYNSIVYGNTASGSGTDINNNCHGTLAAGATTNLVGSGDCGATMTGNPMLSALQTHSSGQKYFSLQANSAALEMADAAQCNALPQNTMMQRLDQIGTVRPQPASTTCDLGAIESSLRKPTPTASATASDTPTKTDTPTATDTATITPTATASPTPRPNNVTLNGTACNIYDAINAANSNTASGALAQPA